SIAFIGVIAALIAVFSWYAGKKVDAEKAIEEDRLKTRVAEANAEAAKANERIAKTDLKAQELELEIISQKHKANTLALELESQKEKTANAEIELLQIKSKITPRSIPLLKVPIFTRNLRKASYKNISFIREIGDDEIYLYTLNLQNIFKNAGWSTGIGMSAFGEKKKGLSLSYYHYYNDALLVQSAFREIGYDLPIIQGPKPKDFEGYISIVVGSR
ncbi:hypothetical protein AB4Y90_08095, partial [Chryseobacterium sp. 2TAF14]|uniref:hypothetical protein n=1 Tax=Chryseobacterium sp. 2TAF14 TaxID=3233007 RepID=UPI003F8FF734